ncbi:MAG: hypothetical protein M3285_01125 [Actinomycetota bacterium]|nr:hypothetical protein [Actinomycetota bacterium]
MTVMVETMPHDDHAAAPRRDLVGDDRVPALTAASQHQSRRSRRLEPSEDHLVAVPGRSAITVVVVAGLCAFCVGWSSGTTAGAVQSAGSEPDAAVTHSRVGISFSTAAKHREVLR